MSDILEHLRAVNALLALLTFGLGCYRFPQAWAGVSSRKLFVAMALFPPIVGLGSGRAFLTGAPPSPVTALLTGAYLFLAYVLIRWPKRLNG